MVKIQSLALVKWLISLTTNLPQVLILQSRTLNIPINTFFKYLKHQYNISIFIQPTDGAEIANIISSLNINKASGPFSIPNKILILLKQAISKQLPDLFNLFFPLVLFYLYLKLPRQRLPLKIALNQIIAIIVSSLVYQILKKHLKNFCIKDPIIS